MRLLLATHNEHKRREFARLLDGPATGWEIEALPDSVRMPPEDGETFAENALGKARAAAAATGRASIADDSGIAAAALGGAPGVRSARYAGERATDRRTSTSCSGRCRQGASLEYVCAIAYVDPAAESRSCSRGAVAGGWRPSHGASAGSAMTRRSSPMTAPGDGRPPRIPSARLPDDGRAD